MNPLKKLLSETGIYGGTTIIGRFLNWLLVPLYTNIFPSQEYGIVVPLMAVTAITQVFLTFGTETGFFRFASEKAKKAGTYTSLITWLFTTNVIFLIIVYLLLPQVSSLLGVVGNEKYIGWLALTLFFDIMCSIPFAKLRLENKALKFGLIKIINILINIGINLFFLLLCPQIAKTNPESWLLNLYNPNLGIGYIFIAYLVAAVVTFLLLLPDFFSFKFSFDGKLLIRMLKYSFPILIVSLAGMINIQADKSLMPHLLTDNALHYTGIYGANYKLGVVMVLFISAFRYAYEPFFFSQKKDENAKDLYAKVLKYFVIFGMFVFLGVVLYIDIFKYFIGNAYHEGLFIVPFILMANLFHGIFYSLSLWYKLTDKTHYGAYLAIGGMCITLSLNFILVPKIGYLGAAIAILVCFITITIASYWIGQKYYPVNYDIKTIVIYLLVGLALYAFSLLIHPNNLYIRLLINTVLLIVFIIFVMYREPVLKNWHPNATSKK